jgi:integrase
MYPDASLRAVRERHGEACRQLAAGIDLGAVKKAERLAKSGAESFEAIAREWHDKFSTGWVDSHAGRILKRLEVDLFPWLGNRPIAEIKSQYLLAALRRIESRGAPETAHRAMQNAGQVFRYAVATGRAERDISGDLRGALPAPKKRHHASITDPKRIGALLRAIDSHEGAFVTKCALHLIRGSIFSLGGGPKSGHV